MNSLTPLTFLGGNQSLMASTFTFSISNPFADSSTPRKSILSLWNLHFLALRVTFASRHLWRNARTVGMCSSVFRLWTLASSRYPTRDVTMSGFRYTCSFIHLWKPGGAFMNLKVRTFGWWGPHGVLNAPSHSCPSLIRSWLYPDFMSNLEKMVDSFTWSMIWSMRGRGYESLIVISFSLL